ncbi:MAG: tetratricopeptide repeat protein [Burkholderiales bacterium]|nr:tetratricopeptide repeat protein [Anaerolineae bacterium]
MVKPAADPNKSVFISYRRKASWAYARLVFNALRAGGYDVFMDIENIDAGEFGKIILNQIAARAHFLVLLAPATVERFDDGDDWMRREIEHALMLERNVVPILVNEFNFREAKPYLTGELEKLKDLNALKAPDDYFDEAMTRLVKRFLKDSAVEDVTLKPTPQRQRARVRRIIAEVASKPVPTENQLTAEQHFNRAYRKHKRDVEAAIVGYTEAIKLRPDYAEAYSYRGSANYRKHEYDAAIADYTQALELNPELGSITYGFRGNAHKAKGEHEAAITDYTRAIELDAENPNEYWGRGDAYYDLKRYDDALKDYRRYIKLAGDKANAKVIRRIAGLERRRPAS